ncbi:DUF202 domain-containing protein [Agromyces italicus]|uniref:DUF202 domain-containing protein n=1 Tax=Agromyces italicus TaxID=279572 RepID=UPI0003B42CD3|nr:DUF202 domain-containing protein [Agromyces italicus]
MSTASVRDPGLQPERTALSWTRTALVVAVNALLALRTGFVEGEPWLVVAGLVLVVAGGAVAAIGSIRSRQLEAGSFAPPVALIGVVTAVTLAAAAAGIGSVVGGAGL